MHKLIYTSFILFLFLPFALRSQDEPLHWFFNSSGTLLLTLTANTDTSLIGGYLPIGTAADTANTMDTMEIFMGYARARFFYDGNVQKVSFYIKDASVITFFRLRIWHGTAYPDMETNRKYSCTGTTADLSAQLVDGVNNITLATPLVVREGDAYSLQYVASDSGIAQSWNYATTGSVTYYIDSTRYSTSLITDTIDHAWYVNTPSTRHFPVKFYSSPSPVIVMLGASMEDGTPIWRSGASYLFENHAGVFMVIKSTAEYKLHTYSGWTVVNFGIGGETSAQMLARMSETLAEHPAFIWIGGTGNDMYPNVMSDSLVKNYKAMIDSCVANNIPFGVNRLTGYTGNTVNQYKSWDTSFTAIQAYALSQGGLWCNMREFVTIECTLPGSVPGNDWWINPYYGASGGTDPVHYNDTGHALWTWKLLRAMRNGGIVIPNDTMAVHIDAPLFNIISLVSGTQLYDQFTLDSANITMTRGGISWYVPLTTKTLNLAYNKIYSFDWEPYLDSGNTYTFTINGYGYSGISSYSGSSATLARPLIPILTSDSSAAPIRVYASNQYNPGGEIWVAFNSDITTPEDVWSTNAQATGWAIVDFGIDTTVVSYSYIARNFGSFEWKDWTLSGSADSLSWTVVDTQTDAPAFTTLEHRRYTLSAPAKYRYWKWNVTENQGGAYLQAVQLQLYGY